MSYQFADPILLFFPNQISALFALDFIQTFPKEVTAIWLKPLHFSSILFLVNRYALFGSLVTGLLIQSPQSSLSIHVSYVFEF